MRTGPAAPKTKLRPQRTTMTLIMDHHQPGKSNLIIFEKIPVSCCVE